MARYDPPDESTGSSRIVFAQFSHTQSTKSRANANFANFVVLAQAACHPTSQPHPFGPITLI